MAVCPLENSLFSIFTEGDPIPILVSARCSSPRFVRRRHDQIAKLMEHNG